MSFFYMTFNRLKYKRTADVDTLVYHGVMDLSSESLQRMIDNNTISNEPWTFIELIDYSGDTQSLRRGDKLNMLDFFSLVYHHNAYMQFAKWQRERNRPLILLNISFCLSLVLFLTTDG